MPVLLPILMYHQVAPRKVRDYEPYLYVSPEELQAQIQQLKHWGYVFLTLAQAWNHIETGLSQPKAAVMTFDDALSNFLDYAFPVLAEEMVPATVFVITQSLTRGKVENLSTKSLPLNPQQLCEISAGGMEVGSHTLTHRELLYLDIKQVRRELQDSREYLQHLLSQKVTSLSYPRGSFTPRIQQEAQAAGYLCACSTLRGSRHGPGNQYALKRIRGHQKLRGIRLWYSTTSLFNRIQRKKNHYLVEKWSQVTRGSS